jgi:hypothetical protein
MKPIAAEKSRDSFLGISLIVLIVAALVTAEIAARIGSDAGDGVRQQQQRRFNRIGTLDGNAVSKIDKIASSVQEGGPLVAFIGNSHSYSTPQEKPLIFGNKQYTPASGLIVDYAAQATWNSMGPDTVFFGIQEPAITPAEMLLWVAGLSSRGRLPSVAIIGATYLNFRGEPSIRETDGELLLDQRIFDTMVHSLRLISDPPMAEIGRLKAKRDAMLRERSTPGTQGMIDRVENGIWAKLAGISAFVAHRAELREFTLFALSFVLETWTAKKPQKVTYRDEASYFANLAYFQAMLRLFHEAGSKVFIYMVPERTDLPPRWPVLETDGWVKWLEKASMAYNYPLHDWRDVLPESKYWGYFNRNYDYAHFLAPGHIILGDLLVPRLSDYLKNADSQGKSP